MTASGNSLEDDKLILGRVLGAYGVKGWVKVFSYTETREDIISFDPWYLGTSDGWRTSHVAEGKRHGKNIIVRLDDCANRDQALALTGTEIAVRRQQLPVLRDGQYYWRDLIGLKVINSSEIELGIVDHLLESGAHDVLVVIGDRERLIPYTPGHAVVQIELSDGIMRVDWDEDL